MIRDASGPLATACTTTGSSNQESASRRLRQTYPQQSSPLGVQTSQRSHSSSFRWRSANHACLAMAPSGAMSGSYRLVDEEGQTFDVAIPSFQLLSPIE